MKLPTYGWSWNDRISFVWKEVKADIKDVHRAYLPESESRQSTDILTRPFVLPPGARLTTELVGATQHLSHRELMQARLHGALLFKQQQQCWSQFRCTCYDVTKKTQHTKSTTTCKPGLWSRSPRNFGVTGTGAWNMSSSSTDSLWSKRVVQIIQCFSSFQWTKSFWNRSQKL